MKIRIELDIDNDEELHGLATRLLSALAGAQPAPQTAAPASVAARQAPAQRPTSAPPDVENPKPRVEPTRVLPEHWTFDDNHTEHEQRVFEYYADIGWRRVRIQKEDAPDIIAYWSPSEATDKAPPKPRHPGMHEVEHPAFGVVHIVPDILLGRQPELVPQLAAFTHPDDTAGA